MEEVGGVKVPVTRRRHKQLSAEQSESPSAPVTPTKKRNTRLAAKPQLELIDELAVTNSPSQTSSRKSISKDLTEPEEKIITPARRSARVKSNTSLVSEAEEKPATPAKRSTRVKSNTSIVSETTQSVDSPRAKRAAARRTSQVGSDTELSLTPTRARSTRRRSTSSIDKEGTPSVSETAVTPVKTRRTRKGSISSIDNTPANASSADKPTSLITEVIIEEPENKPSTSTSETDNVDSNNGSPSTRKSPRLMAKKGRKSDASSNEETSENPSQENASPDEVQTTEDTNQNSKATPSPHEISIDTSNLIRDLDTKHMKISDKNKSMSDIKDFKTKRSRTKSWTTLTSPVPDSNFFSDNESTKRKLKKHGKLFIDKMLSDTGSGDGYQQATSQDQDSTDPKVTLNKSKKNRKSKEQSFVADKSLNINQSETEAPNNFDVSSESNKENILGIVSPSKNSSAVEFMLKKAPSEIKTTVFLEDSDSNTESIFKTNQTDDQCVPVIDPNESQKQTVSLKSDEQNIFEVNTIGANNDSVEPMDIDETMPENVSLTVFGEEGTKSRKTSLSLPEESQKETPNNSKRKTSLRPTDWQVFEKENNVVHNEIKKSRQSSINISQETDNAINTLNKSNRKSSISKEMLQGSDNDKEIPDKSKRKFNSSLQPISQDKVKTSPKKRNSHSESTEATIQPKSRKSLLSEPQELDISNRKFNKSRRKSSLCNSVAELDKSEIENKSTLVLSEIKDASTTETNASKSPQDIKEKSVNMSLSVKGQPLPKNLALDYLTSTPVQQKNIEKLNMQMNSSIITPTNVSKKDINNTSEEIGYKKKQSKRLSESVCNESASKNTKVQKDFSRTVSSVNDSSAADSEASDEEEISKGKSCFLDNEAKDAGEDYESGDSQHEEERQYEKENDILEYGETLTSEDEVSNDTDYEKDSFIVSSAEEDDELLSGSEDDLDMSNNELGMDAKSKNKYNERKKKEQKKASREMYEARHELNKAGEAKSKKSCRSRLDSTLLKSDDDKLPPKKSKRMRLESSNLDDSDTDETTNKNASAVSENEEIVFKKKKSKRLSESVSNESAINEKEITIPNTCELKQDPLSINVKVEPKTPQKDLEISTILINNQIEEINLDENKSMMNANNTIDPLQSSMAAEDNEVDNGSISENEEIANNFDTLLKKLNKEWQRPIKSHDISLNLSKKTKKNKIPIVDELNLTENKLSKKNKMKDDSKQAKEKSVKRVFKKLAEEDEVSGDSIDLNLLLSDESNGTVKSDERNKNKNNDDTFIPLKRTEAKTNIHSNLEAESDDNAEVFNFFIDTKGDLDEKEVNGAEDVDSNEAPVEVFYVKHKKSTETVEETSTEPKSGSKKKKKKLSESQIIPEPEPDMETPKTLKIQKKKKKNTSQEINTSKAPALEPEIASSGKKKNAPSDTVSNTSNSREEPEHPELIQKTKTPTREKKTKKLSKSYDDVIYTGLTKSPDNEKKKSKSQNDISQREVTESESNENQVSKTLISEKKANKMSEIDEEKEPDMETPKTLKIEKKKKKNTSQEINTSKAPALQPEIASSGKKKNAPSDTNSWEEPEHPELTQKTKTPASEEKTKKLSRSHDDVIHTGLTKSPDSEKKKSESQNDISLRKVTKSKSNENQVSKTPISGKKESKILEINKEKVDTAKIVDVTCAQKRKRETSPTETIETDQNTSQKAEAAAGKKKKLKISKSFEDNTAENINQAKELEIDQKISKNVKKNKNFEPETEEKLSRKRKQQDDDCGSKSSKISKHHVFDQVNDVPRLPSNILSQLDDKPKKLPESKKPEVVSTTNFIIEETVKRKNKPSHFLEDTINLNHDEIKIQKKKPKPKVLPLLQTFSISDSGFTTNFKVNVISDTVEFVATSNETSNFKNDYLKKKIKKLRTYDLYKKQRNMKLTKY